MQAIERALADLPLAEPALVRARDLQRRIDTKYIVGVDRVAALVGALADSFAVLPVGTTHVATYENLYFDTPELRCFHDHRRGRRLRQKVRIRRYPEREVAFLEVKTKRSELVTDKRRHAVAYAVQTLADEDRAFLSPLVADGDQLAPILHVDYRRISLVGIVAHERVTIDFQLVARPAGDERRGDVRRVDVRQVDFGPLAVVEVKRAPDELRATPAMRAISAARLREQSISKYCASLVRLSPDVRHNRLLPALRALETIR
jgi:hypothetical protein